jgi:hypothetical protein
VWDFAVVPRTVPIRARGALSPRSCTGKRGHTFATLFPLHLERRLRERSASALQQCHAALGCPLRSRPTASANPAWRSSCRVGLARLLGYPRQRRSRAPQGLQCVGKDGLGVRPTPGLPRGARRRCQHVCPLSEKLRTKTEACVVPALPLEIFFHLFFAFTTPSTYFLHSRIAFFWFVRS